MDKFFVGTQPHQKLKERDWKLFIINKKKKNLLLILVICIIILFNIGLVLYGRFINTYARVNIPLEIKNDSTVLDVEILSDMGTLHCEFYIRVLFSDGNSLEVDGVNEFGKGRKMNIRRVNNLEISIVNKISDIAIDREQQLKFFSDVIGVKLETIMDIVKNYRAICKQVENWPNLSDYKLGGEKIYEVRHRVLEKNLFSDNIALYNGHEYFLYKWNPKLEMSTNSKQPNE